MTNRVTAGTVIWHSADPPVGAALSLCKTLGAKAGVRSLAGAAQIPSQPVPCRIRARFSGQKGKARKKSARE